MRRERVSRPIRKVFLKSQSTRKFTQKQPFPVPLALNVLNLLTENQYGQEMGKMVLFCHTETSRK